MLHCVCREQMDYWDVSESLYFIVEFYMDISFSDFPTPFLFPKDKMSVLWKTRAANALLQNWGLYKFFERSCHVENADYVGLTESQSGSGWKEPQWETCSNLPAQEGWKDLKSTVSCLKHG